ncbi:hypothetical protein ACHAXT_006021 [Thalassiosira profunda]
MALERFPKATHLLYLDTDAVLASPRFNIRYMYDVLAHDGYGDNATRNTLSPSLIVNKPYTGWLCNQCERFNLGHGCFNSGVLLWRRSQGMDAILQSWWRARFHNESQNFFIANENGGQEHFFGWDKKKAGREKMSEQNRLMFIFRTDPDVQQHVWPVPRQVVEGVNTESCPNYVGHVPCLQNDFAGKAKWRDAAAHWNPKEMSENRTRKSGGDDPFCFVQHHADKKEEVSNVLQQIWDGFVAGMV